jgi:hypothetical protein
MESIVVVVVVYVFFVVVVVVGRLLLKYADFFRVSHVPHVINQADKIGADGREVDVRDVALFAKLSVIKERAKICASISKSKSKVCRATYLTMGAIL